jgi:hypothetical protein
MLHEGIVTAAAFSRDGQRLLTGSADRSARLWDLETCLPLSPPLWHNEHVRAVGLCPDGKVALTGRVWRLPMPLPDDPRLIDLWVRLATARSFGAGESIDWLAPDALVEMAGEFESRTGRPWSQWDDQP